MLKTKDIGDFGENAAREYMIKNGYEIVLSNYSSKAGEIDIIAKKDEYIVFVEVKARKTSIFGEPCEFVDTKKQQRIIKTAYKYLEENSLDSPIRFDVCEIIHENADKIKSINYIEGAFEL